MKILWVNNVGNILGGTLACTHSMVSALPDCDNTVFTFGDFTKESYSVFDKSIKLVSGSKLDAVTKENDYDLIVYQNVSEDRLPANVNSHTLHILHSEYSGAVKAHKKADMQLCVSEYLAGKTGTPSENVLHQPVTIPPFVNRNDVFTICRMCTPRVNKWEPKKVIPLLVQAQQIADEERTDVMFEFVGCPDTMKQAIQNVVSVVEFTDASFIARSVLRRSHVMLYDSDIIESFGRVCREAQRCGCVPIIPLKGGFTEQVPVFSGYDVLDMESALRKMLRCDLHYDDQSYNAKAEGDASGSLKVWRKGFLEKIGAQCL